MVRLRISLLASLLTSAVSSSISSCSEQAGCLQLSITEVDGLCGTSIETYKACLSWTLSDTCTKTNQLPTNQTIRQLCTRPEDDCSAGEEATFGGGKGLLVSDWKANEERCQVGPAGSQLYFLVNDDPSGVCFGHYGDRTLNDGLVASCRPRSYFGSDFESCASGPASGDCVWQVMLPKPKLGREMALQGADDPISLTNASPRPSSSQSPNSPPSTSASQSPRRSPRSPQSRFPSPSPRRSPRTSPSGRPSSSPRRSPRSSLSARPSSSPRQSPRASRSERPSPSPPHATPSPRRSPRSARPSLSPSRSASPLSTPLPTRSATPSHSRIPSPSPSRQPSASPSLSPRRQPSPSPSSTINRPATLSPSPSHSRTASASASASRMPSPSHSPRSSPSRSPSRSPIAPASPSPSQSVSPVVFRSTLSAQEESLPINISVPSVCPTILYPNSYQGMISGPIKTIAWVTCDDGYIGGGVTLCTQNGTWLRILDQCTVKPPVPCTNVSVQFTTDNMGHHVGWMVNGTSYNMSVGQVPANTVFEVDMCVYPLKDTLVLYGDPVFSRQGFTAVRINGTVRCYSQTTSAGITYRLLACRGLVVVRDAEINATSTASEESQELPTWAWITIGVTIAVPVLLVAVMAAVILKCRQPKETAQESWDPRTLMTSPPQLCLVNTPQAFGLHARRSITSPKADIIYDTPAFTGQDAC